MAVEKTAYDFVLESLEKRKQGIFPIVPVDDNGRNWLEACGNPAREAGYISMEGFGKYVLHKRSRQSERFIPDYNHPLKDIEIGRYFFPGEHVGMA